MQCKLLTLNLLVGGEIQSEVGKRCTLNLIFLIFVPCSFIQTLVRESCHLKKKIHVLSLIRK